MSKTKIIAVSGGFDPIHVGHIDLIHKASKLGKVIVILNSDQWLVNKKGYAFMPFEERKQILLALRDVHNVVEVDDADGTVCEALIRWKPDYFGNGGDRKKYNTPEKELCEELGVELVWNLGVNKIQSSSDLVNNVISFTMHPYEDY